MLRKFSAFIAVLCTGASLYAQIYRDDIEGAAFIGVLKEYKDITIPLPGAKIQVKGSDKETYSDGRGFFVLGNMSGWTGSSNVILIISADGYETLEYPAELGQVDLGIIYVKPMMRILNPITVNELMPAGGEISGQTINRIGAAALFWGNDALMQAANLQLGMLGFKPRGYDWKNTEFYINGASFVNPATGYADAGMFAGLNTAIYNGGQGSQRLINDNMFYGDLGGFSNLRINPLAMTRRFRASYSFSNSLFSHGLTAGYSTGEMPGGLALSFLLSARTGEGFAAGTNCNGLSYMFAVGKAFDEFNKLTFFALGTPAKRGGFDYSTQQTYDAADDNFYNPVWGDDNGKGRNSREISSHQPAVGLEYMREGEVSQWNTSLAFTFGNRTETGLQWTELVPNPFSSSRQISWDVLREANDTANNGRAHYIIDRDCRSSNMISLNSVYDLYDWGNWATTAGVELKLFSSSFHSETDDLLGGAYYLNIDKFRPADLPSNSNFYQFDVNSPDKRVGEGSRIGYDYSVQHQSYKIWNIWRYFMRQFKFSFGGSMSLVSFEYAQNVANGKFPEAANSRQRNNFFNYTGKGGVAYKLSNNDYVEINGMFGKRAPLFTNVFLAPRITNETLDELRNETVIAGDLNYSLTNTIFDLRVSGFYTQIMNQSAVVGYYDDEYMSRMSLGISGLKSRYFGGDLSAKINIGSGLSFNVAASYGIYKYYSNPLATLMQENTGEKLLSRDTLKISGTRIAGTPQMTFSGGAMYDSPQRWWAGLNINYAGENYAAVNPLRFSGTNANDAEEQEKLKSAFTLDLYGGYTFEFGEKKKKAVSLNLNVQNILGSKNGYLGAYEPFGIISGNNADNYKTRYAYAYGRTVYLMLNFIF